MALFPQHGQTIILEIEGHLVGQILSTDAKDLIPQTSVPTSHPDAHSPHVGHSTEYFTGKSVWLCSVSGNRSLVDWIKGSVASEFNRRNVKLSIIDQVRKTGTESTMSDCLLTQVTLPALDKASSADALMRLVVKPQVLSTRALGDIQTVSNPSFKNPSKVNEFDFSVDGLDDGKFVQSIESMTFEPTKPDSNIVISLPVQHGTGFLKWSDEMRNVNARGNPGLEKTGSIKYLANKSVAMQVNLYRLFPIRTTRSGPSLTIELACGRMEFDGGPVDF